MENKHFSTTSVPCRKHDLLFVASSREGEVALLQLLLEEFVDRERHSLARGNSHDTRRDALVEGVESFLSIDTVSTIFTWTRDLDEGQKTNKKERQPHT